MFGKPSLSPPEPIRGYMARWFRLDLLILTSMGYFKYSVMSRKKHNIAYVKPGEPKFLRDLKIQAGYKEGPTIETKREKLPEATDEDYEDREEEQPLIVVLKSGDLSAEEAAAFKKQKEDEEANAPADLSKPIVFRKTKTSSGDSSEVDSPANKKLKKSKKEQKKAILSFNEEEEED